MIPNKHLTALRRVEHYQAYSAYEKKCRNWHSEKSIDTLRPAMYVVMGASTLYLFCRFLMRASRLRLSSRCSSRSSLGRDELFRLRRMYEIRFSSGLTIHGVVKEQRSIRAEQTHHWARRN